MTQNRKIYKLPEPRVIAGEESKHRPINASHLYGSSYPFIQTRDVKDANHGMISHYQTFSEAGFAQSKLRQKNTMCITIAAKFAENYHLWRTVIANHEKRSGKQSAAYYDIEGFSNAATIAEVQKQDYKLTPGIYVGTEAEEDDGIPFEEKMEVLKAQLLEQFEKEEVLKKQIVANFEKL